LLLLRSGSVRIRSRFLAAISAAATPAAPSRPLPLGLRSRGLLLRRTLLLRRSLLLRTTAAALRTLRTPVASTLALLLLRTSVGTRRLCSAAPLILLTNTLACTLLEVLQLLLHVLADRTVLPRPHLIETAVGTALPAFGIGLLAGCAKDAFRQGHRRAGALYTSAVEPTDDTARRKTVQTLIELAQGSSPADCWDDRRAEDLLRSQSTPEEVRELGMSEEMVARVFGAAVKPRFTVRVSARFEAAHFLREYRGISEPLHGHSYKVEADLASRAGGVDSDAIAVDFVSARHKLEALAKTLDYGCINDVPPFDRINPSAENIAEWFARELGAAVASEDAVVTAVTIWEGPVNSVTFRP
jgi:6-pyruvoyltetrahydropterin/6-carboxytetrahydropterin synthase